MIPNEFKDAVEEVIDFVEKGEILSRPFEPDQIQEFECEVIFDKGSRIPYRKPGLDFSKCEDEWIDILASTEDEKLELYLIAAKTHPSTGTENFADYLNNVFTRLRSEVRRQLTGTLPDDDIAEITLHIDLLVQLRALMGGGHSELIEEKFFNVYRAYGYPCGWVGAFPEGKLVVYSRERV